MHAIREDKEEKAYLGLAIPVKRNTVLVKASGFEAISKVPIFLLFPAKKPISLFPAKVPISLFPVKCPDFKPISLFPAKGPDFKPISLFPAKSWEVSLFFGSMIRLEREGMDPRESIRFYLGATCSPRMIIWANSGPFLFQLQLLYQTFSSTLPLFDL